MHARGIRRVVALLAILGASVATAGQQQDLRKRLTPAEVDGIQTAVAGAGTSGSSAVTTRVLLGDPTRPGLYTIQLRIAPNTTIQPHTHRDTRAAVVVDGVWYFGYGAASGPSQEKTLPRGSFYTEPGGELHFARTASEGATVTITGYGPTDTVYAK